MLVARVSWSPSSPRSLLKASKRSSMYVAFCAYACPAFFARKIMDTRLFLTNPFHFSGRLFRALCQRYRLRKRLSNIGSERLLLGVSSGEDNLIEPFQIFFSRGAGSRLTDYEILGVQAFGQLNDVEDHATRKFGPCRVSPVPWWYRQMPAPSCCLYPKGLS